jgi:lysylphosphatidylglycerol synthetase-like protein (DUF2156 family)
MARKRRQHWLVEVLRGPFAVSDNERNTSYPLVIVLHWLPGVLGVVPSLGFGNLWSLMLLITLLAILVGILYPKRGQAVFSAMTAVSALWLAGSIRIVQALWVAVTARLPHRVIPAESVPRSTAVTIAIVGFAFWILAAAILLWRRRRNSGRSDAQALWCAGPCARRQSSAAGPRRCSTI